MKQLPLSNVQFAINFSQHADFCGGGESYEIIVDTPTGLTKLPECYNSFQDGDYSVVNSGRLFTDYGQQRARNAIWQWFSYTTYRHHRL